MATVVIGGHSRSVGKTSVVAGLIAALPEFNWTAVKITQYGHGICSADGAACDCATGDHSWAISEERDHSGESDTSRFLVAGAAQALWVRTEQGRLAEAMPTLRRRLEGAHNVIIESNSILKFMRPDLYLTVLDPSTPGFQKLRPRIPRPRPSSNPAPGAAMRGMARRLPKTSSEPPGIPNNPAALCNSRNCAIRPRHS